MAHPAQDAVPPAAPGGPAPVVMPEANGVGLAAQQPQNNGISEDEIALYDRQIRLWGMQAQEKIRSANVLLITMKALANEIAKNLVLAGINSLTILDPEPVTAADFGAQFLLDEDEARVGMNRAEAASVNLRKLNPRVNVVVDTDHICSKGPSFFAAFNVVVATDLGPQNMVLVNTATRLNNRPFYAAATHGLYGYIFADLIEHDFVVERDVSRPTELGAETRTRAIVGVTVRDDEAGKKVERVTKRELYSTWTLADAATLPEAHRRSPRRLRAVTPALSCLRALFEFVQERGRLPATVPAHARADLERFTLLANDKHNHLGLPTATLRSEFLRSFLQNLGAEIAPVTAILGGQLAQDVINVLGGTQQPIQNTVIFDGNTMEASMFALHPDDEVLGSAQLVSSSAADVQLAVATASTVVPVLGPDGQMMTDVIGMAPMGIPPVGMLQQ
ncbi:hypothetical protein GGTG_01932 [Gaeumannomyces tritici R3-111a-1]|uniref:Ubiquitin-like 1-activating enzyme E1A n=1 Tax=Gaeumannomyces tritici (strain R3-111a-1) TaxID=644352 RepID=J3NKZ1_GAET3|nr:hypothetical protein GGTG_01932 [Gaeumannomyces tritici R3-111a-1]EJT81958.1 hypothetical protein GGTG_01932 [Gaeumannomyces tritici R3-111a-1]